MAGFYMNDRIGFVPVCMAEDRDAANAEAAAALGPGWADTFSIGLCYADSEDPYDVTHYTAGCSLDKPDDATLAGVVGKIGAWVLNGIGRSIVLTDGSPESFNATIDGLGLKISIVRGPR